MGAAGDTGIPLNHLLALSFDGMSISMHCGLVQVSDVKTVGHCFEQCDRKGGARGQIGRCGYLLGRAPAMAAPNGDWME